MKLRITSADGFSPHSYKVTLIADDGTEAEIRTCVKFTVDAEAGTVQLVMLVRECDVEVEIPPSTIEHGDALVHEIAKLTAEVATWKRVANNAEARLERIAGTPK